MKLRLAVLCTAVPFVAAIAGCGSGGQHAVPNGRSGSNHLQAPASLLRIDPHVGEAPAKYRTAATNGRRVRDINGVLPAMTINVLWDTSSNGHHRTINSTPAGNGLSSFGQTWYINGSPVPGTQPVYTDLSGFGDFMDSPLPNEGGYSNYALQGYAFSSNSQPGLAQYTRYFYPNVGHGTLGPYGNSAGWNPEPLPFWGWPRYNSNNVLATTTTSGGIQASINLAAGGTFWSWIWNGVQFVNTTDYGREIQSDLFCDASSGCVSGWGHGDPGVPSSQNPNEAGDDAALANNPDAAHGSPLASYSVGTNEIKTSTVPLDWNPSGSTESPPLQQWQSYLYNTTLISKDVQFGWGGMSGVARYTTTFHVPSYLSATASELPTGYLQPNFNTYFTEDAATNTLSGPLTIPICPSTYSPLSFQPGSGYGGVIISTSNQQTAMGVYGRLTTVGGPVDHFEMWDWSHNNCPSQTSKWSVVRYGSMNAGDNSFTTFVITGSVSQVRSWMAQLYAMGAS